MFMLLNGASGAGNGAGGGSMIGMLIWLAVLGVLFYFMLIRPQKKKQKEEQKLRESITIGDEIVTIGGLHGRIVSIKEDSYVIESPCDANHAKIRIAKWAVQSNLTVHEEAETAKAQKKDKKDK